MIGKSAWDVQDWFSSSPRLGQSMSQVLSDDGPIYGGGLSPTPSSPFSFRALSDGAFDRYDLVPTSPPHDILSELGVGDIYSTSSDFGGFTHHSNYAGDSIFGTRSHQPQQYFEDGFGETGLGLPGPQPSDFLVPGGNLQRIDEIGLNATTLQYSYDTNPEGVLLSHNGDLLDHASGSGCVSPHSIDPMDPVAAATAAGASPRSTPPATPITACTRERTIRPRFRNPSPDSSEAAVHNPRSASKKVLGPISSSRGEVSDKIPFVGSSRERGADRSGWLFRRGARSAMDSDDVLFHSDSSHRSVTIFSLAFNLRNFLAYSRFHRRYQTPLVCRVDPPKSVVKILGQEALSLFYSSRQYFPSVLLPYVANLVVAPSILEYPPFDEVIHWDGMKRVVLEQPQLLESYILTPVFGLYTLDVFKRKLYVRVPYNQLSYPPVH